MIDTPETLRKQAAKYRAESEEHYDEARHFERKADKLEDEADLLEKRASADAQAIGMDVCSVARRLLNGYLSGCARDIVEAVLDEGHELPGFREVCATYGEALP